MMLQALMDRYQNMVSIFKQRQDELQRYQDALMSERAKAKEAHSQISHLQGVLAKKDSGLTER